MARVKCLIWFEGSRAIPQTKASKSRERLTVPPEGTLFRFNEEVTALFSVAFACGTQQETDTVFCFSEAK
jgi:hypothetical protein